MRIDRGMIARMSGTGRRLGKRAALGLLAAGVALLAAPAGGSAATTLGQTFTPDPDIICEEGFTLLQSNSPGLRNAAPFDGILTSWSHRAGAAPPQLKLKVGFLVGTGFLGQSLFAIRAESPVVTPTPSSLNSYPIRIPVRAGSVVGLFTVTEGQCARPAQGHLLHFRDEDVAPRQAQWFEPEPAHQLDVAARLELDCDRDGFGDETQDSDLSSCRCKGEVATIAGTPGDDLLGGTPGRDVVTGLGGNDTIKSGGGKDVICAGDGSDVVIGGPGNDKIFGEGGRDKLYGGKGRDRLVGGRGKDRLGGGKGRDICKGGKGKDNAKGCEVEKST